MEKYFVRTDSPRYLGTQKEEEKNSQSDSIWGVEVAFFLRQRLMHKLAMSRNCLTV